jgi:hypothetical protein
MSRFNPEPSHVGIPLDPVIVQFRAVQFRAFQTPQEAVKSERPQPGSFQYRGTPWFRFVENV